MSPVDEYLSHVEPEQRAILEGIRAKVKKAVPDAQEIISYGMPTFKLNNQPLLWFASFKDHMSLFPMANEIAALGDKLSDFVTFKGTIQFTVEKPLPESVVSEIITSRLNTLSAN